jgi:hypothetical protein
MKANVKVFRKKGADKDKTREKEGKDWNRRI